MPSSRVGPCLWGRDRMRRKSCGNRLPLFSLQGLLLLRGPAIACCWLQQRIPVLRSEEMLGAADQRGACDLITALLALWLWSCGVRDRPWCRLSGAALAWEQVKRPSSEPTGLRSLLLFCTSVGWPEVRGRLRGICGFGAGSAGLLQGAASASVCPDTNNQALERACLSG